MFIFAWYFVSVYLLNKYSILMFRINPDQTNSPSVNATYFILAAVAFVKKFFINRQ